jgi:hypothetical protein
MEAAYFGSVGGFDAGTAYLSIRPEVRYRYYSAGAMTGGSGPDTIDNEHQFEFVVSVSVHPFRLK